MLPADNFHGRFESLTGSMASITVCVSANLTSSDRLQDREYQHEGGTMTLTKEQNERLTHVGPGTPMGELMRRYWHPVAVAKELDEQPTKFVRILGEDL